MNLHKYGRGKNNLVTIKNATIYEASHLDVSQHKNSNKNGGGVS